MSTNTLNQNPRALEEATSKALAEHERRCSQYVAVSKDISQIVGDMEEAKRVAQDVMKGIDPNYRSEIAHELSRDDPLVSESYVKDKADIASVTRLIMREHFQGNIDGIAKDSADGLMNANNNNNNISESNLQSKKGDAKGTLVETNDL
ncbi:hypothetical protein RFI_17926, partial [Reticulomyxa filosa]